MVEMEFSIKFNIPQGP